MVRVDGNGSGNSLIEVRNLNKQYRRGSEVIDVLQGLDLERRVRRIRRLHGAFRVG